jgi:hypothetical protein
MSGAHVIDTLEFDIGFRTETDAWARHASLGDFAAERAVGVIGEVFDEFVGDERVVRLDQLEIDLGPMRADEDETDTEDRLRTALRRALERLVGSDGQEIEPTGVLVIPPGLADLDRLWTLLHLGRLPWSSARTAQNEVDALIGRVLSRDGGALARALREAADMPRLMARIARQWSPEHLDRLAQLLAQAHENHLTTLDPRAMEVPADRVQAWEQALIAAAAGPTADPRALTRLAARRAFRTAIAEGLVSRAAWDQMLRTEPDFVLGALATSHVDPAARSRLARTLTTTQWRALLALSTVSDEAEILLSLTADAWPWRLDENQTLAAISQALKEALMAHLVAAGRSRVDLAGVVTALVRARAALDGRAVADVAAALVREWPTEGAASSLREPLAPIFAHLADPDLGEPATTAMAPERSSPAPDEPLSSTPAAAPESGRLTPTNAARPMSWSRLGDWAARLERGELDDESWETLVRFEPVRLARALGEIGRIAAWRRAFEARLSPIRLLQLVSLWFPTDEARLLLALTSRGEAWSARGKASTNDPGAAPRRWLLDEMLLTAGSTPTLAAIAEGMIRRQARADGRTPAEVARALVEDWPVAGPAAETTERVRAILAGLDLADAGLSASELAPPTEHRAPSPAVTEAEVWAEARLSRLGAEALAGDAWAHLMSLDPLWLGQRLATFGATETWRRGVATSFSPERLTQLLALWLPAQDARTLVALASRAQAWTPDGGVGDREPEILARQWILEAILAAPSFAAAPIAGAPTLAALARAVVDRRARHDSRAYAETARVLLAAWPTQDPDAEIGQRLAAILTTPDAPSAEAVDVPGGPTREPAPAVLAGRDPTGGEPAALEVATSAETDAWAEARLSRLGSERLDDGLWARLMDLDPIWLGRRLATVGTTAEWRRGVAASLNPERLAQLLSLWLPARDASALVALASRARAWSSDGGDADREAEILARQWVLEAILDAPPLAAVPAGAPTLAMLAFAVVGRRARHDGHAQADTARALLAAWPTHGPDAEIGRWLETILMTPEAPGAEAPDAPGAWTRERVQAGIAALDPAVATPPVSESAAPAELDPPSPTVAAADDWAEARLSRLDAETLDPGAWARLISFDPVWLGRRLAAFAATEAWRRGVAASLSPERLVQMLALWLPAQDARALVALAARARIWALDGEGGDQEAEILARQWILEAVLTAQPLAIAPAGAPTLATLAPMVIGRRARHDGRSRADTARALLTAWPAQGPDAEVRHRLGAILTPPDAPGAEALDAPARPKAPLEAAGAGVAKDLTSDGAPVPPSGIDPVAGEGQAIVVVLPDGPVSAAWLNGLPRNLSSALRDQLASALAPVEAGLGRLSGLAEAERRDLAWRLRPYDADLAFQTLDRLALAWAKAEASSSTFTLAPRRPEDIAWAVLLRELFEEDRLFDARGFVSRWFDALTTGAPEERVALWRAHLADALSALSPMSSAEAALTPPAAAAAVIGPERSADPPAAPTPMWPGLSIPEPVPGEAIYVANAGLVLAGPYIPMLLDRLGLTRDDAFVDEAAAERAVHLLQFLVDGAEPAPEHELMLNKLICGTDFAAPISRDFQVTDLERETIEGLLAAMIQRWSIIGATSVAGLRESFLQRQGVLRDEEDAWRLVVEPRAFDMLLDQIPWGFRTLKLAWMPQVLHVDWR